MSSRQILLIPPIKEEICKNLTFEEAINLRNALDLPNLKCIFPINDKDHQVLFLKGVDDATIQTYNEITIYGSKHSLSRAVMNGNLKVINVLLKYNIDLNARDYAGEIILAHAIRHNHPQIVKLLIEHGADVNMDDQFGNPPLSLASSFGYLDIVKILLENKANINAIGIDGSALIRASRYDHLETVKFLLDHGADVNLRDRQGITALFYASAGSKYKVVEYLKQHGAR